MNKLFIILLIATAIMLLTDTVTAITYAKEGLMNWFHNVVPSLFPFLIIQSVFLTSGYDKYLCRLIKPVFKIFFPINENAYSAIIIGFLCGFPMGAITTNELFITNKITLSEANLLLSFCNNIGPVYFITMILPIFPKEKYLILILLMYLIPFLYGSIQAHLFYKKSGAECNNISFTHKNVTEIFPQCIHHSIHSIVYLGACMILFGTMRSFLRIIPIHSYISDSLFAGILEVGSFVSSLNTLREYGGDTLCLYFMALIHPGGLSCIMQTMCILSDAGLSIKKYLLHQLAQSIIWIITVTILLFLNLI